MKTLWHETSLCIHTIHSAMGKTAKRMFKQQPWWTVFLPLKTYLHSEFNDRNQMKSIKMQQMWKWKCKHKYDAAGADEMSWGSQIGEIING